jgi:hypothetical protein
MQTAAHGKCGDLIFLEAEDTWTHQTFSQDDLTNIKLYLYFFFLDFSCMNLSYSSVLLCRKLKHAALISMQDGNFFSTRLTFFSTTSILFSFSSAWLTLPSLFSLFLCFFAPAPSLLSYFFLTWIFFLRTDVQSLYASGFYWATRLLPFPCEAWTNLCAWKNLLPFFSCLHLSFSWNFHIYAPSPTFQTFTPEQAIQSLSRRTFPASASLKLLSFAETFHFPWIFYFEASVFLLTHQVFNRVRVLFHEAYVFIFLRLRFFLLLFIFLFFASSLIFG